MTFSFHFHCPEGDVRWSTMARFRVSAPVAGWGDPDLIRQFQSFMEAHEIESTTLALKMLVRRALSAAPELADAVSGSHRALDEQRAYVTAKVRDFFASMAEAMSDQLEFYKATRPEGSHGSHDDSGGDGHY